MPNKKELKILAIETSCDDTAIAVLRAQNHKLEVLSSLVSSQVMLHKKYGGIYPMLAKREHQNNLTFVLKKVLKKAGLLKNKKKINSLDKSSIDKLKKILIREQKLFDDLILFFKNYQKPDIDLIAVTNGPGLEPCLWVGINFAKALSFFWKIAIIPVNHIEAHIFSAIVNLEKKFKVDNLENIFPAVCLIVSGGHTQLILMEKIGKYKILGETRDDAAGECFDKTARILKLDYPGGPVISQKADQWKKDKKNLVDIKLPRPMINTKDYDFSFSGLKTAVLYNVKNQSNRMIKNEAYIRKMCYEIQEAVVDVLVKKTFKAAKDYMVKTIILGGGVAANKELRKRFIELGKLGEGKFNILIAPKNLCTDNAIMVGIAAYFNEFVKKRKIKGIKNWKNIKANANLKLK
jgi:N6-L-threonylcarbamoyladenine synthase